MTEQKRRRKQRLVERLKYELKQRGYRRDVGINWTLRLKRRIAEAEKGL